MDYQHDGLFDTIESAHQYIKLLAEVVTDVRQDLENDALHGDASQLSRRQDAIRLALYQLERLQLHMRASSRILNNLRSIRRLLFEERQTSADAAQSLNSI
jgi:hypothetical protein